MGVLEIRQARLYTEVAHSCWHSAWGWVGITLTDQRGSLSNSRFASEEQVKKPVAHS